MHGIAKLTVEKSALNPILEYTDDTLAIPTYISATPAVGNPGGGQVIHIAGTGFRARDTPAVTIPDEIDHNTVSVTVDGKEAEEVRVISDGLLHVRIPEYLGNPNIPAITDPDVSQVSFPPVDIVISNLDDDGAVIPGETVTAPAAFTYQQPLLRLPDGDPPILQVVRAFLHLMKRQVVSRSAWSSHTDFGFEGEGQAVSAEHPTLGLRLTTLRDDSFSYFDNERILIPMPNGTFKGYDASRTIMLVFSLTMSAKTELEVQHLINALIDTMMSSVWLTVKADPNYPIDTEDNKYPLEFVNWPEQISAINNTNITAYSAQVRVRGVPILRSHPLTDVFYRINNINLHSGDMSGDSLVEVAV